MLKMYCDKCGKELQLWSTSLKIFETKHLVYPQATQITFCEECQRDFENWLWYGEKGADDGEHT